MSGFFTRYRQAIIWVVVVAFLVGGVGLLSFNQIRNSRRSPTSDPTEDDIAIVNGETISAQWAGTAAQSLLNQYRNYYQSIGQSTTEFLTGAKGALFLLDVRVQGLLQVIQVTLHGQAAEEMNISVPQAEVNSAFDAQYNTLLVNNGLTEEDLEQILLQQQRTLKSFKDSLKADVEIQLLAEKLRESVIGVLSPTDEELMEYLEANISAYDRPERIRASHILVPDDVAAQDLYAQLLDGADFAALAKEHSADQGSAVNGGDLDWFERGRMVPEFEEAAFALEIGDISEPILSSYGYHIILLTDREAAYTPTLDDVKDDVRDAYIAEQENAIFSDWYDEQYRAADIEILDPLVNAYVMQIDDIAAAIAEYERLLETGDVGDPYFEYYIGRAYESRALQLAAERAPLEDLEEPTEEDLARIEELKEQGQALEQAALGHYLNALGEPGVDADDAFVNRVLLLDPGSTDARFVLAELYADRGDVVSAEAQYDEIIHDDPEYINAHISSGDLALEIGRARKAIGRFEAALALEPEAPSVRAGLSIRLAKAHMATDELTEAESYVAQAEELDPGNAEIVIVQGDLAAARLAEAVEAQDELELIVDRSSEEELQLVETTNRIAELTDRAIDYYEQALDRLGTLLDLRVKLGQVYLLAERYEDADDEFSMVLTRSPYRIDAYEGMAEVHIGQGDTEAALESLYSGYARSFDDLEKERIAARILDFAPEDISMRLQFGELLSRLFKWSGAIREFSAVIAEEPTQVDAYLGIATAYRARQDEATAIEYLQRGLDYASFDSQKEDLYQALIETMQTLEGVGRPLSAEGLNVRIDLARLYLTQGREARALEQLELVQADNPEYRLDEVNALIVQAGGTIDLPVDDVVEPTSETNVEPEPASTDASDALPDDEQ